jgi:Flp pilus assembly pilin Flp
LKLLRRFLKQEAGQDLVEFALLLSVVSLSAMLTLSVMGKAINNTYSKAASTITTSGS